VIDLFELAARIIADALLVFSRAQFSKERRGGIERAFPECQFLQRPDDIPTALADRPQLLNREPAKKAIQ
jgi:hypothetical protein